MSDNEDRVLRIKKYPNRRFYDTTNGGHLTLDELHSRIADGFDLVVTDSKSGEDITNVVLTQMLLDRHAAKLAVFPTPILLQMIRTQQQFLGGVIEQFFTQSMAAQRSAQENWSRMMHTMFPGMPTPPTPPIGANPMDMWAKWFGAQGTRAASPGQATRTEHSATDDGTEPDELEALRKQVQDLQQQVSKLANRP